MKNEKLIRRCMMCGRIKVLQFFIFGRKIHKSNIIDDVCKDCAPYDNEQIEKELKEYYAKYLKG